MTKTKDYRGEKKMFVPFSSLRIPDPFLHLRDPGILINWPRNWLSQWPQSHHFIANNGKTMETVTDLIFSGSKIAADGECSHEIKRCLLLRRKAMTNLDSILKSRDISLPTKLHLVKAMVFPVVMYGCKSWTMKKVECRRIDAFELWCWRRLLRVP